jgi:O-antigen ligase
VLWSVQPDASWLEANRTIAYALAFVGGVTLAREAPYRWDSLIGGVLLSSIAICGYALATKVFPDALAHDEIYARLRSPYGYWNAIGLTAALAVPGCLWLGTRRHGHAAVNALAYPGLGVAVVTLLLSYSRGALLAVGVGVVLWFWLTPLRLRGVAVLGASAALGLVVTQWAFAQPGLSKDSQDIGARVMAGHRFGAVLIVLLVALYTAGLLVGFVAAQRPPSPLARRRAGIVLLTGLALVPVALAAALATSPRGLTGSISYDFNQLTNPHATQPPNDPSRLTAVGSVRARYWNDALKIWKMHPLTGVGAGGFATARTRVRTDTLDVQHAHGYLVQTAADLGVLGLAVSLALLAAWLAATARTLGTIRRGARQTPERLGLMTLVCVVVVFGVSSLVDWTWFVPGNAVPALLCAGWLAGRGPLGSTGFAAALARTSLPERLRAGVRVPLPVARGVMALAVTLIAAWAAWQPLRAQSAGDAALTSVQSGNFALARQQADTAIGRDPLSVDPLYDLALVDQTAGDTDRAQADYVRAVQLQPANPDPWLQLAEFELIERNDPRTALDDLGPALFLDPKSQEGITTYLQASAAAAQ